MQGEYYSGSKWGLSVATEGCRFDLPMIRWKEVNNAYPNSNGAFALASNLIWAHLLCIRTSGSVMVLTPKVGGNFIVYCTVHLLAIVG